MVQRRTDVPEAIALTNDVGELVSVIVEVPL